jgi:hypothetical protein
MLRFYPSTNFTLERALKCSLVTWRPEFFSEVVLHCWVIGAHCFKTHPRRMKMSFAQLQKPKNFIITPCRYKLWWDVIMFSLFTTKCFAPYLLNITRKARENPHTK